VQLQHEQQQESQPCLAQTTRLSLYDTSHNKYDMVAIMATPLPSDVALTQCASGGGGGCFVAFSCFASSHSVSPAPLVRRLRLAKRASAAICQCFTPASAQRIASCRQVNMSEAVHLDKLVAR
jgi:hypothetical protein